MLGQVLTDDSIFQRLVDRRELRLAGYSHQIRVAGIALGSGFFGHLHPIRPFDFERRQCEKQRSGKMAFAADARLRNRLLTGQERDALRKLGRGHVIVVHIVNRAGDRGAQTIEREPRDTADARFSCRQLGPIIGFADAQRGHDTHSGDGNYRAAGFITMYAGRGLA